MELKRKKYCQFRRNKAVKSPYGDSPFPRCRAPLFKTMRPPPAPDRTYGNGGVNLHGRATLIPKGGAGDHARIATGRHYVVTREERRRVSNRAAPSAYRRYGYATLAVFSTPIVSALEVEKKAELAHRKLS